MKDGERGRLIENYGKKEQKEWLDNTLTDPHPVQQGTRKKSTPSPLYSREQGGRAHPHPCTAGNKEEEHKRNMSK